jgi:hypothetical protein
MRATRYFFICRKKDGAVSVSGPYVPPRPDRYGANGFDFIEPYVSRFLVSTQQARSLSIFKPGGKRGFAFFAPNGQMTACLMSQPWQGAREARIRAFFDALGVAPSKDYLADVTRVLWYPVQGTAAEVTLLAKRILAELFGVSPTEALDISYEDK